MTGKSGIFILNRKILGGKRGIGYEKSKNTS